MLKNLKSLSLALVALFSIGAMAQTLDDAPANAQNSAKALLVAVPANSETQDGALVIPMDAVKGIEIKDATDIKNNKAKIAKAIETIVKSDEASKDLNKFLASKSIKNESADDLKSRDAWYYWYYRPYYNSYYYNPYYYNYSNYYYYSYYNPVYYYGGYNYYYYYSYPRGWCW